jgi:predicted ATPase/DNA-binding SARP family transcriptional activator
VSLLQISLFDAPRFVFNGSPWRFSAPPKCLPLLALLALRGEPIPRAALATALWPDQEASDARANLRRHLHALVRALPKVDGVEWVTSDTNAIALIRGDAVDIDVITFLRYAETPPEYAAGVALYRGDLLAGVFDDAIIAEREHLRGLYLQMLTELANDAVRAREYAKALEYAEMMLKQDEWREDALRVAMTVRYRLGDRSGALAEFERFARRLRDDLHAEPMFETSALRDAIVANSLPEEGTAVAARASAARPLVGREAEFATVSHAWLRAARGSGNCVFISGEAGIGKSRLAHEMLVTVEAQGGRAVAGRTSNPESVPYQPLVEAIRQIVPFVVRTPRDDVWLATLASLIPEILRLHPDLPEIVPLEQQRGQLRLQDAMLRAIEACAKQRPLAILLEDLHWAQPATIEILQTLAERLVSAPVLLLVTYRTGEGGTEPPVRALRRNLARSVNAQHVSLSRLGEKEIEVLLAEQGVDDVHTRARIAHISEGNPLFVWQLFDHYSEAGSISERTAMQTVAHAIVTRMETLDDESRAVAEIAATIGDTFSVEEVADVAGWDETAVFAALAPLIDRRLVAERAGTSYEYGFTHAMIAAAIYDASAPERREARHRRIASVLTRTRGERGIAHPLIARHWMRVGEGALARAAFLEAARSALRNYARSEAIAFTKDAMLLEPTLRERFEAGRIRVAAIDPTNPLAVEKAVDELESVAVQLGPEELYYALVARVMYCERVAKRVEQASCIERIAELARDHSRPEWMAEAIVRSATLAIYRGDISECEAQLREIEAQKIELTPDQRARMQSLLARSLVRQGRYEEADTVLADFRAWLDEKLFLEGEIFYWFAQLRYGWVMEDATRVARAAERMVEAAHQRGDLLQEAAARMDLAFAKHQMHDTSGARVEFERALDYLARGHQWQGWLRARINLGACESEIGHFERAERYWREALEKSDPKEAREAFADIAMRRAELALFAGRFDEALRQARIAFELMIGLGGRESAEADMLLGICEVRSGDRERGLELFARGAATARVMQTHRLLANNLAHFIDALLETGDAALQAAVSELASIVENDPHDLPFPGRVCLTLARAAAANGDTEREAAWMERGRELVLERLEAFTEEDDRAAFRAMRHNDCLLAWSPAGAPSGA